MESPLDGIAFLARSETRVAVLRTVADREQTRGQLREDLSASRTTLARVLNELENRGWIRRTGSGYQTTPAAEAILGRFVPLLETMQGLANLGEAVDWLPPVARDIDVRDLRDADITTATAGNPAEPFDRGLAVIREADRYRGLTATAIPRYAEVIRDEFVVDRLDVEGVIEASFLAELHAQPERIPPWRDFARAGVKYLSHSRVPVDMHVADETVLLWLGERDEHEFEVYGLMESRNPAVRSWAESLYDEYRRTAEPLDPATLTALSRRERTEN